jgi:hypothetical protein
MRPEARGRLATMSTLVIGVPQRRAPPDFDTVLKAKKRLGYDLTTKETDEIRPGWHVIVIDKDTRRRADGTLRCLESVPPDPDYPSAPGRTRFHVHMEDLACVPYAPFPAHQSKVCKDGSPWLNHAGMEILR